VPGIEEAERRARFQSLASLVALLTGSGHPLVAELRKAEHEDEAAGRSLALLEALPALTRRKLLSTYAAIHTPDRSAPVRPVRTLGSECPVRQIRPL